MTQAIVKSQYEIERNKPMLSKYHSIIQTLLVSLFFVKYKNYWALSELSTVINGKEKVPNIAIYRKEDLDLSSEEVKTEQIPLGVIEILSPTQNITELIEKSKEYFQSGIKSYWLVVPPLKIIFVFHKAGSYTSSYEKNDILQDEVLDVQFDLSEVFL